MKSFFRTICPLALCSAMLISSPAGAASPKLTPEEWSKLYNQLQGSELEMAQIASQTVRASVDTANRATQMLVTLLAKRY